MYLTTRVPETPLLPPAGETKQIKEVEDTIAANPDSEGTIQNHPS